MRSGAFCGDRISRGNPSISAGQGVLLHKTPAGAATAHTGPNDTKFVSAARSGTVGEAAVKARIPRCTPKPFDTDAAAAAAIRAGKAAVCVFDLPLDAGSYPMRKDGNLVFLDEPFAIGRRAWAVRKDDLEFLKWLNGFLAKIRADGRYQRISSKWFKRMHRRCYAR